MKKTMIVILATIFLISCSAPATETAADSTFVNSTLTVDTTTAEITDTTLVVEGN
jgi:uncharacterized protein YcfL